MECHAENAVMIVPAAVYVENSGVLPYGLILER